MPFDDPTANALAQAIREAFPVEVDLEDWTPYLDVFLKGIYPKDVPHAVGYGMLAVLSLFSGEITEEDEYRCGDWLESFSDPELDRSNSAEWGRELSKRDLIQDTEHSDYLMDMREKEWLVVFEGYRRLLDALSKQQRHVVADVLDWCHARAAEQKFAFLSPWYQCREYAQAIRDFRETP